MIGGQAVALRGHPRLTVAYDFLTTDRRVFERDVWTMIEERGAKIDVRKGDHDDALAGVIPDARESWKRVVAAWF